MPRSLLLLLLVLGCSNPCGAGVDELARQGEARLVHRSGFEPGVVAGAPHAPILLPYVRSHSNVVFERGEERAVLLDVEPDELRGRSMRLDPGRERFAVELEDGWTLFFVPEGAWFAARDPQPIAAEASWSDAPRWRDRLDEVFHSTGAPDAVITLAEMTGPDALFDLVSQGIGAPGGERHPGAMEWAHRDADRWHRALERLSAVDPPARRRALDALGRAYAEPDASEVVLRRARWCLPRPELAVPSPVAAGRARRTDLDEIERAAALLLLPEAARTEIACELLASPSPPPFLETVLIVSVDPSCRAIGPWFEAHACDTDFDCDGGPIESPVFDATADLRDELLRFPPAALAAWKRCSWPEPIGPEIARRRGRLRYRLEVHAAIGWDLIRLTACQTEGSTFTVPGAGGSFSVDDGARLIRQEP